MVKRYMMAVGAAGLGLWLAAVFTPAMAQTRSPGQVFRDCADICPAMVVVPAGSFMMGSLMSEQGSQLNEIPRHSVTIGRAFAVGRYEVTYDEWNACVRERACPGATNDQTGGQGRYEMTDDEAYACAAMGICPSVTPGYDEGWGQGRRPVVNVSWHEANLYVRWLSGKTGHRYRLLSEAEWEYAARAGTTTAYGTGRNTIGRDDAKFDDLLEGRTVPVGMYPANRFGLHDMHGNVWEWVSDCPSRNYEGAPLDGLASTSGDCSRRVLRGGSWDIRPEYLRSAYRIWREADSRSSDLGFRVARTL